MYINHSTFIIAIENKLKDIFDLLLANERYDLKES